MSRIRIPVFLAAMVALPLHASCLGANSEYFPSFSCTTITLLVGIQTERRFQNIVVIDNPLLVSNTLYQTSLDYDAYERISNAK
ncbi:MAG: hypothetical protein P8N11_13425 [Gammaproteobacteria bacterium]|nr:hypothetical protein [Gammaproteobacteria bacterium]